MPKTKTNSDEINKILNKVVNLLNTYYLTPSNKMQLDPSLLTQKITYEDYTKFYQAYSDFYTIGTMSQKSFTDTHTTIYAIKTTNDYLFKPHTAIANPKENTMLSVWYSEYFHHDFLSFYRKYYLYDIYKAMSSLDHMDQISFDEKNSDEFLIFDHKVADLVFLFKVTDLKKANLMFTLFQTITKFNQTYLYLSELWNDLLQLFHFDLHKPYFYAQIVSAFNIFDYFNLFYTQKYTKYNLTPNFNKVKQVIDLDQWAKEWNSRDMFSKMNTGAMLTYHYIPSLNFKTAYIRYQNMYNLIFKNKIYLKDVSKQDNKLDDKLYLYLSNIERLDPNILKQCVKLDELLKSDDLLIHADEIINLCKIFDTSYNTINLNDINAVFLEINNKKQQNQMVGYNNVTNDFYEIFGDLVNVLSYDLFVLFNFNDPKTNLVFNKIVQQSTDIVTIPKNNNYQALVFNPIWKNLPANITYADLFISYLNFMFNQTNRAFNDEIMNNFKLLQQQTNNNELIDQYLELDSTNTFAENMWNATKMPNLMNLQETNLWCNLRSGSNIYHTYKSDWPFTCFTLNPHSFMFANKVLNYLNSDLLGILVCLISTNYFLAQTDIADISDLDAVLAWNNQIPKPYFMIAQNTPIFYYDEVSKVYQVFTLIPKYLSKQDNSSITNYIHELELIKNLQNNSTQPTVPNLDLYEDLKFKYFTSKKIIATFIHDELYSKLQVLKYFLTYSELFDFIDLHLEELRAYSLQHYKKDYFKNHLKNDDNNPSLADLAKLISYLVNLYYFYLDLTNKPKDLTGFLLTNDVQTLEQFSNELITIIKTKILK